MVARSIINGGASVFTRDSENRSILLFIACTLVFGKNCVILGIKRGALFSTGLWMVMLF